MSNTYIVQLKNEQAYMLLQQLEKLDIIKLLPNSLKKPKKTSPIDKFRGILSSEIVDEIQKDIKKDREEWDQRNIC